MRKYEPVNSLSMQVLGKHSTIHMLGQVLGKHSIIHMLGQYVVSGRFSSYVSQAFYKYCK